MWVHEGVVLCVHVVLCVVVSCLCVHVVLRVHVVLCVHVVLGVGVLCVYMWCWWSLARGKPPCMYVQNASVCTVRTSPCVPATGPHVLDMRACCRYTRRRPDSTHGSVLNVHTGGFSLLSLLLSLSLSLLLSLVLSFLFSSLVLSLFLHVSFSFFLLFSLFSFLLYLLFHLLFHILFLSLSLHTQRRDQPDKWLHQLRTAMNHAIHWVTTWEIFACWVKEARSSPPDFHVQRFICAAWVYSLPFSRDTVYRKINGRKPFTKSAAEDV